MKTTAQNLLQINFQHSYFAPNACSVFDVVPSSNTQHLMHTSGVLAKIQKDGIALWQTKKDGLLADIYDQRWIFYLHLRDDDFQNYTQLKQSNLEQQNSVWYCSTSQVSNSTNDRELTLPANQSLTLLPVFSAGHIQSFSQPTVGEKVKIVDPNNRNEIAAFPAPNKPFDRLPLDLLDVEDGRYELYLDDTLVTEFSRLSLPAKSVWGAMEIRPVDLWTQVTEPTVLNLDFQNSKTRWCWKVILPVGSSPQDEMDLSDWNIVYRHYDNKPLEIIKPTKSRHQGRTCWEFLSKNSIALTERPHPDNSFDLVPPTNTLARFDPLQLPQASPNTIRTHKNGTPLSEMYVIL